jgi:hypothetical protein
MRSVTISRGSTKKKKKKSRTEVNEKPGLKVPGIFRFPNQKTSGTGSLRINQLRLIMVSRSLSPDTGSPARYFALWKISLCRCWLHPRDESDFVVARTLKYEGEATTRSHTLCPPRVLFRGETANNSAFSRVLTWPSTSSHSVLW